jgi:PadR family transcriptional regulator PadR
VSGNSNTSNDIERELPLKSQWFYILLALAEDPGHGSGIVRSVLEQSNGKLRLWPATLYGSLEDLVARGWIEELTSEDDRPEESERRRYYRITRDGSRMLAAEATRLQSLASAALERVTSGPLTR